MSLKYEPCSELLHVSATQVRKNDTVGEEGKQLEYLTAERGWAIESSTAARHVL